MHGLFGSVDEIVWPVEDLYWALGPFRFWAYSMYYTGLLTVFV